MFYNTLTQKVSEFLPNTIKRRFLNQRHLEYNVKSEVFRSSLPHSMDLDEKKAKKLITLLKKQGGCLTLKQFKKSGLDGDAFWITGCLKRHTNAGAYAFQDGLFILFHRTPDKLEVEQTAKILSDQFKK
jgi:hypothetical protein